MKKYLPWAGIVALLIGLALLPGPKAGAAVPSTLTSSVVQNATGTGLVVGWTLTNTAETPVAYFIYGCVFNPADCSADFGNEGPNRLLLAVGASVTFHQDYPCGTTTGDIDIAAPYPPPGFDLPGSFTTTLACVPPTTTTTTVPVPPVATPPAPPAPTPPVVPPTPPATVQAPLAFTGSPVLPEIAVALTLIALGTLLLGLRRKLAG